MSKLFTLTLVGTTRPKHNIAISLCCNRNVAPTDPGSGERVLSRGRFRGSSLGSLETPFLKLATYQQTLTELADTHSCAVTSDCPRMCALTLGSLGLWF